MEAKITVEHVNGIGVTAKFDENGDLQHKLAVDCVLPPGALERLLFLFKQKVPVIMVFSSQQAQMDLEFVLINPAKSVEPASPTGSAPADNLPFTDKALEKPDISFEDIIVEILENTDLPCHIVIAGKDYHGTEMDKTLLEALADLKVISAPDCSGDEITSALAQYPVNAGLEKVYGILFGAPTAPEGNHNGNHDHGELENTAPVAGGEKKGTRKRKAKAEV